ncbi:lysophospholipid acyltransferase family protein [Pararhodobacter marinus]|uniref:Lauroyl acyltransferase n=1 Tax=Pararhodobacter marinus TaxID=2184063 RepID=A0A2U2C8R9_9RHOB|nr:lysophospholipid acyltransferase family protein [Pararhodobacter marinus]PWE28275.1 lauroyl acyltransferase [Pararhodobacter marinus]
MTADTPPPPLADDPETAPARPETLRDRLTMLVVLALLRLPFRPRVALAGAVGTLIGRVTALGSRVAKGVRHFRPDLPEAEIRRIARAVPGNLARLIVEVLSPRDLTRLGASVPQGGPGLAALDEAHAAGRPVIMVSAHFGNYELARYALIHRGYQMGGYFKELGSPALNRHYVEAMAVSGHPMFPDTGEGLRALVRFLRKGGMLGILIDLDRPNGTMLDFLGQPTRTVTSIAEMALRYDALLIPVWGIRTSEAPFFRVEADLPIPHSDPETMTQALNDAFGAQVRKYPEQWVWWHNRRKKSHP